jgi:LytS/YehU family sensor histidine kinase
VLSVTDNGPGLPEAQDEGLGLRNVRARLEGLYGEDQALHLTSAEGNGTRAVLRLPYHTSASLYTASGTSPLTDAAPEVEAP